MIGTGHSNSPHFLGVCGYHTGTIAFRNVPDTNRGIARRRNDPLLVATDPERANSGRVSLQLLLVSAICAGKESDVHSSRAVRERLMHLYTFAPSLEW
jgi:hypothetical protein